MWCNAMLCYVYIYIHISPQQSLQKTLSGASPSSFQLSTAGAVAVLAVAQRRRSCLRWVTLSHSPTKQRDPLLRGVKDEHILTDTRESRCLTPEKQLHRQRYIYMWYYRVCCSNGYCILLTFLQTWHSSLGTFIRLYGAHGVQRISSSIFILPLVILNIPYKL